MREKEGGREINENSFEIIIIDDHPPKQSIFTSLATLANFHSVGKSMVVLLMVVVRYFE